MKKHPKGSPGASRKSSVTPGAAVAAYRNVAWPVTEARDVVEAGAVAVAAICGVDLAEARPRSPREPRPKHHWIYIYIYIY